MSQLGGGVGGNGVNEGIEAEHIETDVSELAASRRRLILNTLSESGGTMNRETLAETIAVKLTDSVRVHDSKLVRQIWILLHHVDAPMLADRGFVTYNHYTGCVTITERGEQVGSNLADSETAALILL